MKSGLGNKSGPNGGQANGDGSSFTEESSSFKKDKLNASGLDPRGTIVGKIDIKGPSRRGDATIGKGITVADVVQELTEAVEKEPLPVEHRKHVETYQRFLLGAGEDDN